MIPKKKRIGLFIMIIAIYFSLFFGSYLWYNIHSAFLSKQEIVTTSAKLSLNETDPLTVMNKIAEWLKSNMKWDVTRYRLLPFYLRKVNPSANWVMSVKRGACEEYAILFAELARNAGIESRVTYNLGEDHVWNEVWINGSWTHFDATLQEEDRFDNPGFYERSRNDGGWDKQLSYVYSVDSGGVIYDVTDTYTNTGNLVVNVERDGFPVENVEVIVLSRFLVETRSHIYRQPRFAVNGYTDHSGSCSFNLGENNYTIIAQIGGERAESNVTLVENTSTTLVLHLAKSGTAPSFPRELFLIVVVSSIVVLASMVTYYFGLIVIEFLSSRRVNARIKGKNQGKTLVEKASS